LLLSGTAESVGGTPLLALDSMLALALPAGVPALEGRLAAALVSPSDSDALPAPLVVADPPPVLSALETEFAAALGEPSPPMDAVPELEDSPCAVPLPETLAFPLADALADSEAAAASNQLSPWPAARPARSSVTGATAKTSARLLIVAIKDGFDCRFDMRLPFCSAHLFRARHERLNAGLDRSDGRPSPRQTLAAVMAFLAGVRFLASAQI